MSQFKPTHEIETRASDGSRRILPVMLVNGSAFSQKEWAEGRAPVWSLRDGMWLYHGMPQVPDHPDACTHAGLPKVHRLGRGSDPRRGTAARRTLPTRIRDDQHEKYTAAATAAGLSLSEWVRRELDVAAARTDAK